MSLEALKRNGHNLELGSFELSGEYGIPALSPVQLDKRLTWIRFNHALREPSRERCGVHFFIDDYLFQRAWHDPPRYALFLRSFPAVMTRTSPCSPTIPRQCRSTTTGASTS